MSTFLTRIVSALLRFVLVAAGLLFGLMALLAGLLLAVWLVALSLLRGRKPQVHRFRMRPSQPPFGGNHQPPFGGGVRRQPAPVGDVVDIEAREVPDAPQRVTRDRG